MGRTKRFNPRSKDADTKADDAVVETAEQSEDQTEDTEERKPVQTSASATIHLASAPPVAPQVATTEDETRGRGGQYRINPDTGTRERK